MPDEITTYVSTYAPELDPEEVRKFMAAHSQPDDQPGPPPLSSAKTLMLSGAVSVSSHSLRRRDP